MPVLLMVSFDVKQQVIRHGMKEKLELNKLQTISVPANEVVWMDEHEIFINDYMFDIVSSTLKDGVYTFTGLYDEEETKLLKQRIETFGKTAAHKNLLLQFVKWLQLSYDHTYDTIYLLQQHSVIYTFLKASSLLQLLKEVATPPPQRSYLTC
jgi:hypothetical protein